MIKKILLLIGLLPLLFVSCSSEEENNNVTPKLIVDVKYNGDPLKNAFVKVFKSFSDLQNNVNAIGAITTNDGGIAIFESGIEANKNYYVDVEEVLGCKNNYISLSLGFEEEYKKEVGVLSDELNTIQINTDVTGELTLKNETANGYLIKILEKEVATLAAGEELNFNHFPVEKPFFVSVINVATNQEYPLDDFKGNCSNDNTFIIN
ncbi:hypothetical protein V3A08_07290 [Tenacibaculum maritimum]|uniref:hypothetical protein n=1 Tax=Tenacibaculum maritimum TaxID=107401 RepID=UPI003876D205